MLLFKVSPKNVIHDREQVRSLQSCKLPWVQTMPQKLANMFIHPYNNCNQQNVSLGMLYSTFNFSWKNIFFEGFKNLISMKDMLQYATDTMQGETKLCSYPKRVAVHLAQ